MEKSMTTYYTIFNSPIGQLLLTSDGTHITRLFMNDHEGGPTATANFAEDTKAIAKFGGLPLKDWEMGDDLPIIQKAKKQVDEFFAGKRQDFDLPLKPEGSEFQRTVWDELTRIPFGKTISYGELARRIGKPEAPRAVGLANGKNPISIIVPCHRVIGASGKLTGYGGGLDRKVWLLEHEGAMPGERQPELAMS
jgi:methylated-DNA-[protein]-cysteine S-methyltransferase